MAVILDKRLLKLINHLLNKIILQHISLEFIYIFLFYTINH